MVLVLLYDTGCIKPKPFILCQIFPNGSLSVHRLTEGDQGEYTCGVQNMHGKDQINYDIIVQGLLLYHLSYDKSDTNRFVCVNTRSGGGDVDFISMPPPSSPGVCMGRGFWTTQLSTC